MKNHVARSLVTALCALPIAFAQAADAPASGQGTVVGTIDVRYQPPKGLLGKMSDSTRSRKWVFRVGLDEDRGVAYRVQQKLEIREGSPRAFELSLSAGRYRFVDGVNELSGGMETLSVPIDASFEVAPGGTVYVGRLVVDVQGKTFVALAAKAVIDCRDVDLPAIAASHPNIAVDGIGPAQLMSVDRGNTDAPPVPGPTCEAPKAP